MAETWRCCERGCMTHSQSRGIRCWTFECVRNTVCSKSNRTCNGMRLRERKTDIRSQTNEYSCVKKTKFRCKAKSFDNDTKSSEIRAIMIDQTNGKDIPNVERRRQCHKASSGRVGRISNWRLLRCNRDVARYCVSNGWLVEVP